MLDSAIRVGVVVFEGVVVVSTSPSDSVPRSVEVVPDSAIRVGNCVVVKVVVDSDIRVDVVIENDVEVTTAESDVVDAVT